MSETLRAEEIAQLARFDEHWRVTLAGDNRLLVGSLAKRGRNRMQKRTWAAMKLLEQGWPRRPELTTQNRRGRWSSRTQLCHVNVDWRLTNKRGLYT